MRIYRKPHHLQQLQKWQRLFLCDSLGEAFLSRGHLRCWSAVDGARRSLGHRISQGGCPDVGQFRAYGRGRVAAPSPSRMLLYRASSTTMPGGPLWWRALWLPQHRCLLRGSRRSRWAIMNNVGDQRSIILLITTYYYVANAS